MDVYIHESSLYCEACAGAGGDGPYSDGGGEADSPYHCADCGAFLENPLTSDGYDYVRERIAAARRPLSETLQEWSDYYGVK